MSVKSLIIIEKIKNEIKPEKLWKLVEMLPETLESFKEDVRSFFYIFRKYRNYLIIFDVQVFNLHKKRTHTRRETLW